ncbi:misacylated tRNA(Ala) deacylase [Chitinivorax tropicus]|uniref:Alanine--tRNA ligase n=1 Tax=Chitinivorax tropicus TaxID=714531 RepID=A0A840MJI8_9PROT|nr:alanyl-tRNA editing protein [Chitinivorax tropicus]MBB5016852.1 misacylated tRNA(Ala) deacylase [Chitinivorax tropicus]
MTQCLFRDDAYLQQCQATVIAVDERGIELSHTVFYPLGGGQPGDTGTLACADGRVLQIIDTRKGESQGSIVHIPAPDSPTLAVGDTVSAQIDWARRYRLMRMHTALHLLSVALPYPVTGGQIAEDKGRLDFDLQGEQPDKDSVAAQLNALITTGLPVTTQWITDAELDAQPELVKTMSVTPPRGAGQIRLLRIGTAQQIDLQPCGGTHVGNTAEIGPMVVQKIENKGKQNRRVTITFA